MSLVPYYDASSESSNECSSDAEEISETEVLTKGNSLPKLPPPDFQVKGISDHNDLQTNSVFKNPFLEAEHEKAAVLQRHVKMVDLQNTVIINGRKICWNYRKGKCRFGHNCKFAHDSDIQKTPEQILTQDIIVHDNGLVAGKQSSNIHSITTRLQRNEEDEQNSSINMKRKRPGLTQGLIPGRKIMKNYMNQKN